MKIVFLSILTALVSLTGGNALAQDGLQGVGDARVTNSWEVDQSCFNCGPLETFELFIVEDTGAGPFSSPGLGNLPAGWNGSVSNPNYALATGPSNNDPSFSYTEYYQGDISASVRLDMIFWSGEPVTSSISFAASFTRSVNGALVLHCQSFGEGCPDMQDPTGIGYDRGAAVPVPILSPIGFFLLLVAMGVAGSTSLRRRKTV